MSVNLLDLIPVRNIGSEELSDGRFILLKPKFKHKFFVKHILPRLKSRYYRIKLDDFGSFVWKHCDGKNTVGQIGNLLSEKFKQEVDPVYDRLAVFMQSLARYQFILYNNYEAISGASK
ncbi:MAG: PqqD family protein [Candidatus Zhuqueibacterota bacterium]